VKLFNTFIALNNQNTPIKIHGVERWEEMDLTE
jgi:hypothetical protein